MKNLWILFVAFALLITGTLSLLSRSEAPVVYTAEKEAARVAAAQAPAAALQMAGLPKLVPSQPANQGGFQALPTEEQMAQTSRQLSDRALIGHASELLKRTEDKFEKKHELTRMNAIAFLASAAHWGKNPERETVLAAIDEALTADNAVSPSDERQRRSIAGDKRELFEILLREKPERAAELEQHNQGNWLSPILRMGRSRFELYSHGQVTAAR